MSQWYIIEPNNTWSIWMPFPYDRIHPRQDGITLHQLQNVVGGYIEYLPDRFLGKGVKQVIVNEEGIPKGLPMNLLAEVVFKEEYQFDSPTLRGTVIVHAEMDFGHELDRLRNHLAMFYEITNRTKSEEI